LALSCGSVIAGSPVFYIVCPWDGTPNTTDLIGYALESESHPFSHLLFALSLGLCVYNFFRAITLDPGTAPKPSSDAELKSVGLLLFLETKFRCTLI